MEEEPWDVFAKVTLAQMYKVDREIFARAALLCEENLQPNAQGLLPLDLLTPSIMKEARIQTIVIPVRLPQGGTRRERNEASEIA